jgi:hypothetical protein
MFWAAISSPLQRLLDLGNLLIMQMICLVLVRNTSEVEAWLKQYQDDMVTEEGY